MVLYVDGPVGSVCVPGRRAHKCHLEYLENMGVTGSIAIAISVHDQLWGLVIGHHWTPKFISYQMRMAGDFLAQALAMRISTILDMESHNIHRATLALHAKLFDLMSAQGLNPGLRLRCGARERRRTLASGGGGMEFSCAEDKCWALDGCSLAEQLCSR
jgi:hypothetical protein